MKHTSSSERTTAIVPPWHLRPAIWFAVAAILTSLWVSWSAFEFPMSAFELGSDYWEHTAAIAEWKKDLWNPQNPHLFLDVGTPRYMPFFFVLTVIANWFDLDPVQAMAVGATINMVLFSLGVFLFFRHYFRNDWAPLVGFVVLLCGWGLGWIFSNLFQLRDLFFVAAYPSMFVFALCFFAWWEVTRLIRGEAEGLTHLAALALLIALMLTCHPLTGAFGLGTIGLMVLLEPGAAWTTRVQLLATLIVGALLTELWPYFSTWEVSTGVSAGEDQSWIERGAISETPRSGALNHAFYDPVQVLIVLGPALLGLPALLLLLAKRQHLFIVAGFLGTIGVFLFNLVFPIPLGHRFLLFAAVFLQLALAWWILHSASAWRATFVTKEKPLRTNWAVVTSGAILGIMVLWNVAIAALQFGGFQAFPDRGLPERYTHLQPVLPDMRAIAAHLPDDAIVIGHPNIVWPLPTFRGKTVAMYHGDPMVPDLRTRSADVASFLDRETSQEARRDILDKYGVTHILYKREWQKQVAEQLNALGEVVFTYKGYVLIRIAGREGYGKPKKETSQ